MIELFMEECMHIIAENSRYYLTENDKEWLIIEKGDDSIIESKDKDIMPQYPLALVFKWGYKPVDIEFLNKLSEELK